MSGAVAYQLRGWSPEPHQASFLAPDTGIAVAIGGVGSGKSDAAALRFVRWALELPRRADGLPVHGALVGPDYRVVKAMIGKVLAHIGRLDAPEALLVARVVGGQEPKIVLTNGVVIEGFSGTQPQRLKAHEIDFAWIDECQLLSEEAFALVLNRMRSAAAIRLTMTGSPLGPGWVWRLCSGEDEAFAELRRSVPLRIARWASRMNSKNSSEVLAAVDAAANVASSTMAKQETGGLFVGTSECPDTAIMDYAKLFVGRVEQRPAAASVAGIDLGRVDDFTWITVLDGNGYAVEMQRFNLGTVDVATDDFWPYTRSRVIELVRRRSLRTLVVDAARGGDAFCAFLRQELGASVRVEAVPTDSPGKKSELLDALAMAIAHGRLRVPSSYFDAPIEHVEQLRLEFRKLTTATLPGGKRRYGCQAGSHDDGVLALALANFGLTLAAGSGQLDDLTKLLPSEGQRYMTGGTDRYRFTGGDLTGNRGGYVF